MHHADSTPHQMEAQQSHPLEEGLCRRGREEQLRMPQQIVRRRVQPGYFVALLEAVHLVTVMRPLMQPAELDEEDRTPPRVG